MQVWHAPYDFSLVSRVLTQLRENMGVFPTFGHSALLGGPIVNIPVLLVQKSVILLEVCFRHAWQMLTGEGAQEEIRLERPAFA